MKIYQRRAARKLIVQALYQHYHSHCSQEQLLADYLSRYRENKVDIDYLKAGLTGVLEQQMAINEVLQEVIDRPLERLQPMEHVILQNAVHEMLYRPDVPIKTSINEAIELAKKYGSIDGYRYVNGVLDAVVKKRQLI